MRGARESTDEKKDSKNFVAAVWDLGCSPSAKKRRASFPLHKATDLGQGQTVLRKRKLQKRACELQKRARELVCAVLRTVMPRVAACITYDARNANLLEAAQCLQARLTSCRLTTFKHV